MVGNYFSNDTIAAVATSLAGDGGVGVIRISGAEALSAATEICAGFENPKPRFLHRIEVIDPFSKAVLDDGMAAYFPRGHSFTGEEVVELQLHGGRYLLQSILQLLITRRKCRLALAGEFSFRAVRNGKLSLTSAEALSQVIGAKSLFEVQAARRNLGEARTKEFDDIASAIKNLLAQAEISIDFSDQDVEVFSPKEMSSQIAELLTKTEQLSARMTSAMRLARGLLVTLAGLPNAGKSTLFNALLAEDRAIVSEEAGTTRDVITEEISVGPYCLRLADTAGLRNADGLIEKEGIHRARQLLADSDVVVIVIDGSEDLSCAAEVLADVMGTNKPFVTAINKWDTLSAENKKKLFLKAQRITSSEIVPISAATGEGLVELVLAVRRAIEAKHGIGAESFLPTEFQLQMLLACREALVQGKELLDRSGLNQPELVSAALTSAIRALSDLVGETTPDTVLEKIFSEFCIGK